ncbi:MAG: outer membrane protein assembly factor [Gemmatimonadaceae bacterium]|jgi:hypothetical protein|nr:outer membrane protein assembly factor [Gemmatimonadaceae bacterium]
MPEPCRLPFARAARLGSLQLIAWGLGGISALGAQSLVEPPVNLPRAVVAEVLARWNAPGVRRVVGPLTVSAGDTVRGDLAVLNGPVRVAGVVAGRLLVVNGVLRFDADAVVTGDVLVVGGEAAGRDRARLDGDLRVWRASMPARLSGDSLFAAVDTLGRSSWERWRRAHGNGRPLGDIFIASARTYNRVEGLPIIIGPRLRAPLGRDVRLVVDAFGIVRTGDRLEWTPENRGHSARAEVTVGQRRGLTLEGQLYDEVVPVESWALRPSEVGLGTLLLTRDYADYYGRKGAALRLAAFAPGGLVLSLALADERWRSRDARDVWTLLERDRPFRPNPQLDEGRLHVTTARLSIDTRNDRKWPQRGWWVDVQHESGVGTLDRLGTTAPFVRDGAAPGRVRYGRLFADLRRYNRLAPNALLNARLVLGLRTAGTLPLQRRWSVSGIDAVPGFTFRTPIGDTDVGTCGAEDAVPAGAPAQCDGMALLQLEWRGEFSRGLPDAWLPSDWIDFRGVRGAWVLFANSGRGWLSGAAPGGAVPGRARWRGDSPVPSLSEFRTDLGAGLDFGGIGVYVAVPVSSPGAGREPTVFLRTGRRF